MEGPSILLVRSGRRRGCYARPDGRSGWVDIDRPGRAVLGASEAEGLIAMGRASVIYPRAPAVRTATFVVGGITYRTSERERERER